MNLKDCDFLLTFKCVSKCRHCAYRGGPHRKGNMKVKDFQNYLAIITDIQSLDDITFHGGEPFIYFKTLKSCVQIAHELGQKEIGVITNGCWGMSLPTARRKLQELKRVGLSSIWFSVDAFHQEFVPFRSVYNAIHAAMDIGLDDIVVTSNFLGSVDSQNLFNLATEEAIERLGLPEDIRILRSPADLEGRAADLLRSHLECKPGIPSRRCVLPFWAGHTLKDPKGIEIDFSGNVTICAGLCIGNAKTESLSNIIQEYDYTRHPIIKFLAGKGPYALLELAEAEGYTRLKRYVNECHLCYELRRHLREHHPQFLAPESCYKE